jgi:hypothetical protein
METGTIANKHVIITVDIGAGNSATDADIVAISAIPDVITAVAGTAENASTVVVEVASQEVAKPIAGKIARLFPGKPVRWSSTTAS